MKLVALTEAKYHGNTREYFLTTYCIKEDEDEEDGYKYEYYSPKPGYLITTDWEENGNQILIISFIASGFDPKTEKWHEDFNVMGWDDPLPDTWSFESLEVYKKVS